MTARRLYFFAVLCMLITTVASAQPFSPRTDFVWARAIPNGTSMTLDGRLNEAVWAAADSIVLRYGQRAGDPGSGSLKTSTNEPTDPANAVIKFLVDPVSKKLYLAVSVKDSSVGGPDWENCDGFFASTAGRGDFLGFKEIIMWWLGNGDKGAVPSPAGWLPSPGVFNGAARVLGTSSSDTGATASVFVADTGYVMEMSLWLDTLGVNPANVSGDVLPLRICMWDGDFNWPNKGNSQYSRVWWQGEWTSSLFGRVYMNPAVTTTSGTTPVPPFDLTVKNGTNYPTPAIDGNLTETVWSNVPSFAIQYKNAALLSTYPPMGRYNSNGWAATAPASGTINDTGICVVKYFFKGDSLYFGFDVNDRKLISGTSDDFSDAVRLIFWDGADSLRDTQGRMKSYRLTVRLDAAATAVAANDLTGLISRGAATFGVRLKNKTGGSPSTIDNPGDTDAGYTAEIKLDLTKLGYAAGASKKTVFFSMNYNDANVYTNGPDSSCTRTWWFHEWEGQGPSALSVLDETNLITSVGDEELTYVPGQFSIAPNYPNPFNPATTIRFTLPEAGAYQLRFFDLLGRVIATMSAADAQPGVHQQVFNAATLPSGVYYYNVEFTSSHTGVRQLSETGKMILMK